MSELDKRVELQRHETEYVIVLNHVEAETVVAFLETALLNMRPGYKDIRATTQKVIAKIKLEQRVRPRWKASRNL